jgi:hypothetical protein
VSVRDFMKSSHVDEASRLNVLERLGTAAKQAAEVEAAKKDSRAQEHEARVAVLRTALELARPALSAILTRTRFGEEEQHVALIGARNRQATQESLPCRWQLYVTAIGSLVEDRREFAIGAWVLKAVRLIDEEEAADLYAPEDVAARLLRHCVAAAEGRNKRRTDEALRRAARFNALAALLESIG